MTPLDTALQYAQSVPVFPCKSEGPHRKSPWTPRGFHDASSDPDVIRRWWSIWPNALIGMPTGPISGRWVLDIDNKSPEQNGFDTLEDLGHSILPLTPMAHTPSGGIHVYVDAGGRELKCSTGLLGPGIDIRGVGGYVILPAEDTGYYWDPIYNFDTVAVASAPSWLWPPKPSRPPIRGPIKPVVGLSRYGVAAIESACNAIVSAPRGEQERTLNAECFSIGSAAGAGLVPANIALSTLLKAANAMPDHAGDWPWRPEEIDYKVRRAFNAGLMNPREVRHALVG